ncbi:hypothetical protein JCM6882_002834 [Rhodosporidiobolus microsporus]
MDGSTGKSGSHRRFSPSSSIVPDSQSPEPRQHQAPPPPPPFHRDAQSTSSSEGAFRPPALPSRRRPPPPPPAPLSDSSVDTSVEPPRIKREADVDEVKPKKEDVDALLGAAGFGVAPSPRFPGRERSNAPEPSGRIKREIKEEETDDVKIKPEPVASMERERTEEEEARRVREQAPSVAPQAQKEEEDEDEWIGVRRGRPPRPTHQQVEGAEQAPVAKDSSVQPQASTSGTTNEADEAMQDVDFEGGLDDEAMSPEPRSRIKDSLFLDDDRDRRSLTSVSPEPHFDEEDFEMDSVGQPEGTPFEESEEDNDEEDTEYADEDDASQPMRSKKRKKPAAPEEAAKKKRRAEQQKEQQTQQQAEDFLATLARPLPRNAVLKAKITNKIAAETEHLFPFHAVDAVVVPSPRAASPAADDEKDDKDDVQVQREPPPHEAAGPVQDSGAALEEDDLPDFEEEQEAPEAFLEPRRKEIVVEEQAYFAQPTRNGAVSRWVAILGKEAAESKEPYSFTRYEEDRSRLLSLDPPLSHSAYKLVKTAKHELSPDFLFLSNTKSPAFDLLLSKRPSPATVEQLWTNFLDPDHPAKHRRPDEPETRGTGRGCLCPLFVPEKRPSWPAKRAELEGSGLDMDDLLEVVEEVFGGTRERLTRISVAGGVRVKEGEELLEQIYQLNWFWFDQITELASISLCYSNLCDSKVAASLVNHLVARAGNEQRKVDDLRAAVAWADKVRDSQKGIVLHRELLMTQGRWEREEPELKALLKRIRDGSETRAETDLGTTTAASIAGATATTSTRGGETRPISKPAPRATGLSRLPYARPETPNSRQARFEGWQQKDAGPGKYAWRSWQQ